MKFVVKTQHLENYGAHDRDGKFSSGNAYWKFKGGTDYIVSDCERHADAMAFVMSKYSQNNIFYKMFPTEVLSFEDWENEVNKLSSDYRDFIKSQAIEISPLA